MQKNLDQLIDKLVSFVLYVRRFAMKYQYSADCIIALDKMLFWVEIVSVMTAKYSVTAQKSTHEITCISFYLAAKVDGTKLPPFILFKKAKWEMSVLDKEIKKIVLLLHSETLGWPLS